jgi:hypothetical protein
MTLLRLGDSLLARRDVQRLLVVAALCFGGATWGLEALLSNFVRDAPHEPFGGVYRLVEAVLWIGAAAIAIRVAERWPIESAIRQWRRTLAQLALAIALGPVWGAMAYAISPYLMPWWYERGMWGVIAKEAKGALLGYGVTTVLVHVILRARRQRAREVAASAMERAAADAQLVVRKLELQPALVLRSMDAIARMIPRDVDTANEALVALADGMRRSLAARRVEHASLGDEAEAIADALHLRSLTIGPRTVFTVAASDTALNAGVPTLLLPPLVDALADGHASRAEAQITMRAERDDRCLVILIECRHIAPALREPSAPRNSHLAATTLEEQLSRLHHSFGDTAKIRCEHTSGVETLRVEVPWMNVTSADSRSAHAGTDRRRDGDAPPAKAPGAG